MEKDDALQHKIRDLLQDFSRALSAAMADSTDVDESLRRIQNAGYSLCLRVDCKRDGEPEEQLKLTASEPSPSEPVFQINGSDLSFLRSIGIDPTRRLRRRRNSSR